MLQCSDITGPSGASGCLLEQIDIDTEPAGRTKPYHIVMRVIDSGPIMCLMVYTI